MFMFPAISLAVIFITEDAPSHDLFKGRASSAAEGHCLARFGNSYTVV